ncbi:hypothetical protein B0H12DRAFT_1203571 [Mycena haematopus]|nr:hypothetical protein B0H12DRAFT_1203571 [Mycena haematopus]
MAVLAHVLQVLLRVLHSFHFLITLLSASWDRLQSTPPLPLHVTRRRIPHHLALLLVLDPAHDPASTRESLLETVNRTVGWCRSAGIEKLTLYDTAGVLMDCLDQISQCTSVTGELNGYDSSSGSDIEYPLTPPSSDYSDSRPLSPEDRVNASVITVRFPAVIRKKTSRYGLKKRHSEREISEPSKPLLTLCIASRQSSKPAIATAATSHTTRSILQPSDLLSGPHSLSDPDFMIVHHLRLPDVPPLPLELYGFPPWQIRLTEIQSATPANAPQSLTELDFRVALDEYARAEMRFGK